MAETGSVVIQAPLELNDIGTVHSKDSININHVDPDAGIDEEIPTVDYMMLFSEDPILQAKAIHELGLICKDYGYFNLVNHIIPDSVIEAALKGAFEFFDMTEEEKSEFGPKNATDMIRWGLGFTPGDHNEVKREYLKLSPHPKYHCPYKPSGFSDAFEKYCKGQHEVSRGLARAVSKTLGLDEYYIEKAFKLDEGFDVNAVNMYPPCDSQDNPVGLPAHYDPGCLILLVQNVNGGLQLYRNGKWVNAHIPTNAIFVNIGDHLEILTNGKYKSAMHRVMMNNKIRRLSMPTAHGPSIKTFVAPAPECVTDSNPPTYVGMTYEDSLKNNGYDIIDGKSSILQLRL